MNRATTRASMLAADSLLRGLIDEFLKRNLRVTLAFGMIPPDLADELQADSADPFRLLDQPDRSWVPYFRSVLDAYGQRVSRWQLGREQSLSAGGSWATPRDVAERLSKFRRVLSRFIPGPVTVLPTAAELESSPAGSAPGSEAITVLVPSSFRAVAAGEVVRAGIARGAAAPETTYLLEMPDASVFGHRAAVIEVVRRAVLAWAAHGASADPPPRLGLVDAWLSRPDRADDRAAALRPLPELGVLSVLSSRLAGRRVIGEFPVTPGVRCFILADPLAEQTSGALVAWNEGADPSLAVLRAYLGGGVITLYDPFGNGTVSRGETQGGATEIHTIALGETPVFIEGVDARMLRFIASFHIEPGVVPSIAAEHDHDVILENPWPVRVSGSIRLHEAASHRTAREWKFVPSGSIPFSILPGQSQRIPISFSFGPAEEAGPKEILAQVQLNADRAYSNLQLRTHLDVGAGELELSPSLVLSPTEAGPDVSVVVAVTNHSSRTRSLEILGLAPEQPRATIPLSNLGPGESAVRRFAFPGAAAALSGRHIRVVLSESDGVERINRYVRVP
ncbi:MAG: hypothetical protein JNM07_06440 [Phycisphaerae bacterium]|nr:hypothetical protein [Phycisphaerae bacterium]